MPGRADSLIRMASGIRRNVGGLSFASVMVMSTSTLPDLDSPKKNQCVNLAFYFLILAFFSGAGFLLGHRDRGFYDSHSKRALKTECNYLPWRLVVLPLLHSIPCKWLYSQTTSLDILDTIFKIATFMAYTDLFVLPFTDPHTLMFVVLAFFPHMPTNREKR